MLRMEAHLVFNMVPCTGELAKAFEVTEIQIACAC